MQLIDTHSHIDLQSFTNDREDVLIRCRKLGIIAQVLPGVYRQCWPNLFKLCEKEFDLFAAPGLHPMYLAHHMQSHLDELEQFITMGHGVALGEIGLDFYIKNGDHLQQQVLFEAQLKIAKKFDLPVLLHVRKAHDQVQATLRRMRFERGGIVHAFSGSLQQAENYLKLNFKIGFGGTITYSRATKIRSIARQLPLDSIVLETDAPDIPPSNHHGERNSPEYLPLILEALQVIRKEDKEELAHRTTMNAIEILQLEKKLQGRGL